MKTEAEIFVRKQFDFEKMELFGFQRKGNGYQLETDFMNGDFKAVIFVTDQGAVSGQVIDKMNEEEYAPLRAEGFTGGYVNAVRTAYEELLAHIAEKCCRNVWFSSDQANRITENILRQYAITPDFPWKKNPYQSCGVFRHADNRKWFALMMNIKRETLLKNGDKKMSDVINLKIDPEESDDLLQRQGIYPAYHMNHKSWISVLLEGQICDREIMNLVAKSFSLTQSGKSM